MRSNNDPNTTGSAELEDILDDFAHRVLNTQGESRFVVRAPAMAAIKSHTDAAVKAAEARAREERQAQSWLCGEKRAYSSAIACALAIAPDNSELMRLLRERMDKVNEELAQLEPTSPHTEQKGNTQ